MPSVSADTGPSLIMNTTAPPFLSLARKWRPRSFAELVGHEYAARVLQNAARESRLHHAFLFTGTRGVGKTTLARIVAKTANCENLQDGAPCLSCNMCEQIAAGRLLDVVELDAASHTQVDKMRELLESAKYPPSQGRCKVFIIDEAHMLSKSAFSAMLKTLEEPPDYLKFVLATTDPQKLPPTIMSRCLCFGLRPLEREQIAGRLTEILKTEGREFEDAAVNSVARLARGSMRDGLSILEQALAHTEGMLKAESVRRITGDMETGIVAEMLQAVASSDARTVSEFAGRLTADGAGFDAALSRLAAFIYKIALAKVAPDAASDSSEEAEVIQQCAPLFSDEELQTLYEIVVRGRAQLPHAPDERTGFEMTLLRMMCFIPRGADSSDQASPRSGADHSEAGAVSAKAQSDSVVKSASANGVGVGHGSGRAEHRPNGSRGGSKIVGGESADDAGWKRAMSKLSGTARALSEHCVLVELREDGAVLRADKTYAGSSAMLLPELQQQLRRIFHAGFHVTLEDGENDAAADARNQELTNAAMSAPFVREVMAIMPDAKIRSSEDGLEVEQYRNK